MKNTATYIIIIIMKQNNTPYFHKTGNNLLSFPISSYRKSSFRNFRVSESMKKEAYKRTESGVGGWDARFLR